MSVLAILTDSGQRYGYSGGAVAIAAVVLLATALIGFLVSSRLRYFLSQPLRSSAPLVPMVNFVLGNSPDRKHAGPASRSGSAGGAPTIAQDRDDEMRASEQRFRQLAETIGAVFWMTDASRSQMIYVSLGYEKIWGRTCASLYASSREWFDAIHPEDRDRVLEVVLTRQKSGDYDEEYRIVRPEGSIRWIHDRAFPVRNEAGEVYRIAGIAEDITERKRLEKEVIEISDREQRRLGNDLHDGICQQLVSIAFATDLLRRDLVAKSPHDAVRLARITALLDNAIIQARNLSHALYPVNLVGNGLGFALRELASSISQGRKVVCEAQCAEAVLIHDHALATHLYRIAQEAVQSATRHADPSRILICLSQEGNTIYLNVMDNGSALNEERNFGVGLSIMKYRASMAGGRLDIERGPLGGTVISVAVLTKSNGLRPNPERGADGVAEPVDGRQTRPEPPGGAEIPPCAFPEKTPYYLTTKGDTEPLANS
jgi:PAS domain S-box-containing protein